MTNLEKMHKNAKDAARLLKAIAHDSRLLILCLLSQNQPMSVGALLKHSNLSQSAFSQHLSVLRKENLVKTKKEAQTVYYSLKNQNIEKILSVMYEIYCKE
ncbi:metalloregulator ArsR/SmtB family transcription factor [Thiotrichales bacterium 19S3-7]|nr:metalloregulator ArsR/SmtB family transcription factor [Thiotrichales bacterium 19S3-7]MCF6802208.1 metalloregulator ArsR/SmtB family transcription factor [Thiotrichales bacterium 19S3-11]